MSNLPENISTQTILAHSGRRDKSFYGPVNTPVVRASTMLFPDMQTLKAAYGGRKTYGRHATESTLALENALCAVEGANGCLLTSSGLSAITSTLLTLLQTGDHLLMCDSVYDPTRAFCNGMLQKMGVQTTYYDPEIGADIQKLMQANTRVVFVESPGSLTFEIQDIPAIAKVAHSQGAAVVSDSTWATPLGWKPFDLGVDVSIHAATKYIVGHSDVLMGAILCNEKWHPILRAGYRELGLSIGGDDAYLALRGLRTLAARLAMHRKNALEVALWLKNRPEIDEILYPPLEGSRGHAIWSRDFNPEYACGLMGVVFKAHIKPEQVESLVNATRFFGIGFSWGGFESLMIPTKPVPHRSVTQNRWMNRSMARLHIGLESVSDLLADLEQAFSMI